MRSIIAVAILVLAAAGAFGVRAWLAAPPPLPELSRVPGGDDPLKGPLILGSRQVAIDRTPMIELARVIEGVVHGKGSGADYLQWMCFRFEDRSEPARLWIASDALGRGYANIFILARRPNLGALDACPELPAEWIPVTLPSGLGLGMTSNALTDTLGTASTQRRNGLVGFIHHAPTAERTEMPSTTTSAVWAVLTKGEVSTLWLTRQTAPTS